MKLHFVYYKNMQNNERLIMIIIENGTDVKSHFLFYFLIVLFRVVLLIFTGGYMVKPSIVLKIPLYCFF